MSFIEHFILFVISLLANTFSALSGGGAGLIQFPVLIFLGLTFSVALATHKVASVALGVGAALRYISTSRLERQFVILLLVAGLPGVVIGGSVILMVPDRIAEIALGVLTGSLGIYSLFKPALGQLYTPLNRERHGYLIGAVVLFFLGILNGSLTSGTGLFVTIWLILWIILEWCRRDYIGYSRRNTMGLASCVTVRIVIGWLSGIPFGVALGQPLDKTQL